MTLTVAQEKHLAQLEAQFAKAETARIAGDPELAIELFDELIDPIRNDETEYFQSIWRRARHMLGVCYKMAGRLDEARQELEDMQVHVPLDSLEMARIERDLADVIRLQLDDPTDDYSDYARTKLRYAYEIFAEAAREQPGLRVEMAATLGFMARLERDTDCIHLAAMYALEASRLFLAQGPEAHPMNLHHLVHAAQIYVEAGMPSEASKACILGLALAPRVGTPLHTAKLKAIQANTGDLGAMNDALAELEAAAA